MLAECDNADRKVFALALALGAAGLIVASIAVTTAVTAVHSRSDGSGALVLAGLHLTYPALNGAGALLLTLAAIGALAVVLAARACWRQGRQYHRLMAQLRPVERLHQPEHQRLA